jgi:hypothetical protein
MSMQWFRMYSEFSHDPKVQMMTEAMQRRFIMLLCLQCSNGLVTLHEEEIAFHLRISQSDLSETKALFISKGFINASWELSNWSKRQFSSDSSKQRVAKHRTLQKEKQDSACNVTETLHQQNSNGLEQNRTEQNRTEAEKTHTAEFCESNDQPPTPPPPPGVSSSPGAVCKAIKSVGINAVNPAHPEFLSLLAQGVTQASFVESAKLAHAKGKGFAYLLGVVKGQLQDAKTGAERAGCRPIPRNAAHPPPESFKQRDDRIARQRWEEQTGREHPDNAKARTVSSIVIDITPHPLELAHDASR